MPAWSLLVWLTIGAIAGLIARGFVGGYGLALLGVGGSGTVGGLIVTCVAALAGALLLVWLSKRIRVQQ